MNSPIGTNRAIFLKRNLNCWVCGRPRPAANPALFKRGGIFNLVLQDYLFGMQLICLKHFFDNCNLIVPVMKVGMKPVNILIL